MNRVKELFQKSVKELSLEDEEMLEGWIHEESYQEYPDEVFHVEDLNETFDEEELLVYSLSFDEDIWAL
jgi:hypothetical protein